MGTANLTQIPTARHAGAVARAAGMATGAVIGSTVAGALAAAIDPALGPATHPQPTLTPGVATAWSLWQHNARVLAVPFILAVLRFADTRAGRTVGDLAVCALAAYSPITVGLALGRWGAVLIPYLPNMPLEWTALAVSIAAWLLIRAHATDRTQLIALGGVIVVLLAGAAALETWATPHRITTVSYRTTVVRSRRTDPSMRGRRSDGAFAHFASAQRWWIALTPSNPDPFKGGITA